MTTPTLTTALAALAAVARDAGIPEQIARTEGERLAAAVAESAPGAPPEWVAQVGAHDIAEFFAAASAGRRWRTAPTDVLASLRGRSGAAPYAQALADVVRAAATLGTPGPHVGPRAAATAATQLGAVSGLAPGLLPSPASSGVSGVPVSSTAGATADVLAALNRIDLTALGPASANQPEVPSVESILAALGRGPSDAMTAGPRADAAHLGAAGEVPGAEQAQQEQQAQENPASAVQEQAEPEPTLEELLVELDALVGLSRVKTEIRRQVELLRVEKLRVEAGLTSPTLTRHLVFVGNPGTGKTTVARLVSGIYRALGLLSSGHLVEVDRSELVAGYLGQTAIKTAELVGEAVGGVLFVDEAYALTQTAGRDGADSYGQEAVNTLVKEMEDHRDDLVVIVAGYPVPMAAFVAANPGLQSRFSTTIHFEDYTDEELESIFALMARAADFDPTPDCLIRVSEICSIQPRDASFGNARFVRNLLDAAIARHAWRLRDVEQPTLDQLRQLLPEDLVADDDEASPSVLTVTIDDEETP